MVLALYTRIKQSVRQIRKAFILTYLNQREKITFYRKEGLIYNHENYTERKNNRKGMVL